MTIECIEYSAQSLALFGEGTKVIKEQLKGLGGKFNKFLSYTPPDSDDQTNATKRPGWIVKKSQRDEVMKLISSSIGNSSDFKKRSITDQQGPQPSDSLENKKVKTDDPIPTAESSLPVSNKEAAANKKGTKVQVVTYSEKALALFGDTKPIKDQLKALGARFNPVLTTPEGTKSPGMYICYMYTF
jgi:hypothetical protein